MKKHITIATAVLISLIGNSAMAERINVASNATVAQTVERAVDNRR